MNSLVLKDSWLEWLYRAITFKSEA